MRHVQVAIVGAGPAGLVAAAAAAGAGAEVVVFDRLVSQPIMDLVPASAERVDVGKQAGSHPVPQQQINEMLVGLARTGRRIVRLKGGDPFMFGRGGEEALALKDAGIEFEVVPGITAAQGCAASLKLPLTHRAVATGVRYVTGHCRAGTALELDWPGLVDPSTTLVIYMGLAHIGEISRQLIAHGRDPGVPVAAVSKGTQAGQRHVLSSLGSVGDDAAVKELSSPVVFIVGEVVDVARILESGSDADLAKLAAAAE